MNSSEEPNSFTILHHKFLSIECASFSPIMDLIGVITTDGSIIIYRTITWERVFAKQYNEISVRGSPVTTISFCPTGACIALGLSDGNTAIVNIETEEVHERAISPSPFDSLLNDLVVSLDWKHCGSSFHQHTFSTRCTWRYGGLDQAVRADPLGKTCAILSDLVEVPTVEPLAPLLDYLLLAVRKNGVISGSFLGIYPVFVLQWSAPAAILRSSSTQLSSKVSLIPTERADDPAFHLLTLFSDTQLSTVSIGGFPLPRPFQRHFAVVQHSVVLQSRLESHLDQLLEIFSACGRKWKEVSRIVPAKFRLIQELMDTYALKMSPLELFFSVALCGQWHPAAASSFSQHWSEQALQRFKSQLDATAKHVLRVLQLRAKPIITSLMLTFRELAAIFELMQPDANIGSEQSRVCCVLTSIIECLDAVVDQAVTETRLAKEGALLFVQFIRESAAEANATDKEPSPDLSSRKKYQQLFDPRIQRPGLTATTGIEHITGTFLHLFLLDGAIPSPPTGPTSRDAFPTDPNPLHPKNSCFLERPEGATHGEGSLGSVLGGSSLRELRVKTGSIDYVDPGSYELIKQITQISEKECLEEVDISVENCQILNNIKEYQRSGGKSLSAYVKLLRSESSSLFHTQLVNTSKTFESANNNSTLATTHRELTVTHSTARSLNPAADQLKTQNPVSETILIHLEGNSQIVTREDIINPVLKSSLSSNSSYGGVLQVFLVDSSDGQNGQNGQELIVLFMSDSPRHHRHQSDYSTDNNTNNNSDNKILMGRLALSELTDLDPPSHCTLNNNNRNNSIEYKFVDLYTKPQSSSTNSNNNDKKKNEDQIRVQISFVLAGSLSTSTEGSLDHCTSFVLKIPLSQVEMTPVALVPDPASPTAVDRRGVVLTRDLLEELPLQRVAGKMQGLRTGGCGLKSLSVCGARGVALIADLKGRVHVLDLENGPDDDDESDEEEEEES